MPELTGMDVYVELARMRPGAEQRIVFMTGGAFTPRAQTFLATVPNQTLYKPFTPDQLLQLVAEHDRRRLRG
jgi:CheY-like chemotaxis protein